MSYEHRSGAATEGMRTWVEIDLQAIRTNVRALCSAVAPAQVMAVVKADGYGHGMEQAAVAALHGGAAWLGVATSGEAVALRQRAPEARICLLAPFCAPEAEAIARADITPLVGTGSPLLALAKARPGARVHLEVDTGMGRSGARPDEIIRIYETCRTLGLNVEGFASHFAAAGGDNALTRAQLGRYAAALSDIEAYGFQPTWRHICNSAGILTLGAASGNLVRPGLLVYGIVPALPAHPALTIPVQPALTWYARIAAVRDLPAGSTISYDATVKLRRKSRVATVQVGYGDGYPTALSNKSHLLIRGAAAPVLGRVCMDQLVVDVTALPGAEPGGVCVCIGRSGDLEIKAGDLAARAGVPEHAITTGITARVPRVVTGGDSDPGA